MSFTKKVFLQAYAEKKSEDKLDVTLKVIYNLTTIIVHEFTLPEQKSLFIALTDTLYNMGDDKKPSYTTKKEFREEFIDYTLALNFESVNTDDLTEHYNSLFRLTKGEGDKLIFGLDEAEKSFQESAKKFQEELTELRATALESYEHSKSETPMPQTVTPVEDSYDDLDELDIGSPGTTPGPAPINPRSKPTVCGLGGKAPVKNLENLSEAQQRAKQNAGKTTKSKQDGTDGTRLIEPVPPPVYYPGDDYLEGDNNAGIICSRDEYYRKRGHPKSGAVYIYAGRSPNNIKVQTPAIGDKKAKYLEKPNDLVRDSAYVYISQKADPDELLKIAGGTFSKIIGGKQPRKTLSLVALKADDVVIASRISGIRLITGTDSKNTSDCDVFSTFGIDLISGNNDKDLQPLVKGDNLVIYLKNLSKALDNLRSILYVFLTSQVGFNAAMASHDHFDPFLILMGSLSTGNPLQYNKGRGFISPQAIKVGTKGILQGAIQQWNTINQMRNRINNDQNAFEKNGDYRILSERNRTN